MNKSVANDCKKIIINVSRHTSMGRHWCHRKNTQRCWRLRFHLDHFMESRASMTCEQFLLNNKSSWIMCNSNVNNWTNDETENHKFMNYLKKFSLKKSIAIGQYVDCLKSCAYHNIFVVVSAKIYEQKERNLKCKIAKSSKFRYEKNKHKIKEC